MKVYKIVPASYAALRPRNPQAFERAVGLNAFIGRPMLARWELFDFDPEEPQQLETDFFYFGLGGLAFPQRTLDVFKSLFERVGEVLPFTISGDRFHALNVLRRVDCLDISRSEVRRLPGGQVLKIDRYAFHSLPLETESLFSIPQEVSTLFSVSETAETSLDFFRAYGDEGMTGLTFEQVYLDD